MKNIIINVDDLGFSEPVNQAVVNLAKQHRINATSFMSFGDISQHHLTTLKQQTIYIGLHIDFTGLAPTGLATGGLINTLLLSWSRYLSKHQVTRCIEEQFSLFEEKIGHAPHFIDGHQHVHQFPIIRECLLQHIAKRYPNQRLLLRSTRPLTKDVKSQLIYVLGGRHFESLCNKKNLKNNTGFAGAYNFKSNMGQLEKHWDNWLSAARSGSLIMCHPAIGGYHWDDEIYVARQKEYEWLSSDAFALLLDKHQISLGSALFDD